MATSATTTMSVTQALAEMKMLDKRLQKGLDGAVWIAVATKTRPVDEKRMETSASSQFQSYMALAKRREALKRAVVQSNAMTKVKIGTWEGSVAEAIENKSSIAYYKHILNSMKTQLLNSRALREVEETNLQRRLDQLLASELGKDVKTNPETIVALTNTFRESNKIVVVDPLGLEEKVRSMEAEIESFESNVDWALSEANGRTMISIPA